MNRRPKPYQPEASGPIGVFDSGIGGTTILCSVRELLPAENYIFFGDSANCPFGTKSLPELKRIVVNATNYLLARRVKIIIVACNTATTQTIEYLRQKFPFIHFVGTEPAIKLACDRGFKKMILLSTEGTAHSPRTRELIEQNIHSGQTIDNHPCLGLAEAIETGDTTKIHHCLEKNLKAIPGREKIEAVILGCTHYPLARDEIQSYFPNARLIDGGEGVAKQTLKLLKQDGLLKQAPAEDKEPHLGEAEFFFSKARK